MKILVIKLSELGDVLLITPALRALRERYPAAQIDVLTTAGGRPALEHCPDIDHILVFQKHDYDSARSVLSPRSLAAAAAFLYRLRARQYSHTIILHHLTTLWGAVKFAGLSALIGGAVIGLDNGRGWFFHQSAGDFGFGARHEVEYWLEVVATLGALPSSTALHWTPDERAAGAVEPLLSGSGRPIAALYGGSGAYSLARRWPVERFIETGKALAAGGYRLVTVGTETDVTAAIAAGIGPAASDLGGKTTLAELAEVLRSCALVVGNDGGVMHLAAAVGAPTVTVFGPSNERAWRPWNPLGRGEVIVEDVPCRPCFYRGHSLGAPEGCPARMCLTALGVQRVLDACGRVANQSHTLAIEVSTDD